MTEERESETAINVDGGMAMSYRLPQGRMLRIQRALGWTLHCDGGVVHLTQQGDARDIVLGAGGAAALATNGRVLLDAHGDAHLRLAPPGTFAATAASPLGRRARCKAAGSAPAWRNGTRVAAELRSSFP